MSIYVMTGQAVQRYKNAKGTPPICRFCGEQIQEGEVCVRDIQGGRHNRKTVYVHKKCDESRRY